MYGAAYGCIIDGCPSGLELSESDIQVELDRRKPGISQFTSQRHEEKKQRAQLVGLQVENMAQRSSDYEKLKEAMAAIVLMDHILRDRGQNFNTERMNLMRNQIS